MTPHLQHPTRGLGKQLLRAGTRVRDRSARYSDPHSQGNYPGAHLFGTVTFASGVGADVSWDDGTTTNKFPLSILVRL